jgi:hypothetical protein
MASEVNRRTLSVEESFFFLVIAALWSLLPEAVDRFFRFFFGAGSTTGLPWYTYNTPC